MLNEIKKINLTDAFTFRIICLLFILIASPACNEEKASFNSKSKAENVDNASVTDSDEDSIFEGDLSATEESQVPSNITGAYLACESVPTKSTENRFELGCQLADENGQLDLSNISSANWTVSFPADSSVTIVSLTITDVRYHYQFAITSNKPLDLPLLLSSAIIQAELKSDPSADTVELFTSNVADALNKEMKQSMEVVQVCFYEDPNYGGMELCFLGPISLIRFEEVLWDNEVTSITIQGNVRVSLFSETDYLGEIFELTEDVPFLGNFNFDDLTSSFKIETLN